jgi:plastocyanin
MRSRIPPVFLIAVLLFCVMGPPAHAATLDVSMTGNTFSPRDISIARGDTVRWTNNDSITHNTTGNAMLNLWSSGNLAHGGQFSRSFTAAGTYGYHCTIHSSMTGSVKVPVTVTRSGNTITVRVASANAAAGFQRNIWRKIGSGAWAAWTSITGQTTTMTGTTGVTYSFKSRLLRTSNSATSAFSAIRSITL